MCSYPFYFVFKKDDDTKLLLISRAVPKKLAQKAIEKAFPPNKILYFIRKKQQIEFDNCEKLIHVKFGGAIRKMSAHQWDFCMLKDNGENIEMHLLPITAVNSNTPSFK